MGSTEAPEPLSDVITNSPIRVVGELTPASTVVDTGESLVNANEVRLAPTPPATEFLSVSSVVLTTFNAFPYFKKEAAVKKLSLVGATFLGFVSPMH